MRCRSRSYMYHWRRLAKLGLKCRYKIWRWNRISVQVQYEAMRREISIYPLCSYIHLLNLIFLVLRQQPEFFFRLLERFNFNIDISIWMAIRGLSTSPAQSTSASIAATNNTTFISTTIYLNNNGAMTFSNNVLNVQLVE